MVGKETGGHIARLNLGPVRLYLLTDPDHVQQVLVDKAATHYAREGMLWAPLERLIGTPTGPGWTARREVFQKLVAGPQIARFANDMVATIVATVDEMLDRAKNGPLVLRDEMARIVYRAITRVLIGDKISTSEADRLGTALTAASAALQPRIMAPFVPFSVPFPGDRVFRRAVKTVDELVFPIVESEALRGESDGHDIVSLLLQARTDEGARFSTRELRDGMVSLFVAGTETTTVALTLLWVVLAEHPEVMDNLYAEIDRVVGAGPVTGAHLASLDYTKRVALEILRLNPPGWMLPRTVTRDDVIDGVSIPVGSVVVVSPYLTHRLPEVWDEPLMFDPDRFAPGAGADRHRHAYLTFGAGLHGCVGRPFFTTEAQAIIAAILAATLRQSRRLELVGSPSARPQLGLTLRPRSQITFTAPPADQDDPLHRARH